MAGSRDWFIYTSDNGVRYLVNLDESNAEATGFPHFTVADAAANLQQLPKNMKMRFVRAYNQSIPDIKRNFYVPTPLQLLTILTSATVGASTYPGVAPTPWSVTTYQGERQTNIPSIVDTGLNDGDAEG